MPRDNGILCAAEDNVPPVKEIGHDTLQLHSKTERAKTLFGNTTDPVLNSVNYPVAWTTAC